MPDIPDVTREIICLTTSNSHFTANPDPSIEIQKIKPGELMFIAQLNR